MDFLLYYVLIGLLAGFLAGLLGIGGGLVFVPALVVLFSAQEFSETVIMPLALGTSLAAIVFTSLSSAAAHHARRAVNWQALRGMTPGVVSGAFLSAAIAAHVPSTWLKLVFAVYAALAATQLLCDLKPLAPRSLPGRAGLIAAGCVVGGVSGLAGAGGAVTCIPLLVWWSIPARSAIGTAAAIGIPVSVGGTAGYIVGGWPLESLPAASLGFVYLPALILMVAASMLTAPVGARVSHALPVPALQKLLATVLYAITVRMLLGSA
jgi:uncharacterized membrane protein YfcA